MVIINKWDGLFHIVQEMCNSLEDLSNCELIVFGRATHDVTTQNTARMKDAKDPLEV